MKKNQDSDADICDMLNTPVVVFRGCNLPEIFKVAKIVFFLVLIISTVITMLFTGVCVDGVLYGLCLSIFLQLPICWLCWGTIGRLKRNKPVGYYDQKLGMVFDKLMSIKDIRKQGLYVPSQTWSTLREME